jgi:uncharacterized protein (TIGR02145 family)
MKHWLVVFLFLPLIISSAFAQDTVHVKTGWNILGSVNGGAVPDILTTTPPGLILTAFFGYSPDQGYKSTDTLQKGYGYWVKVSSDGIIVFSSAPMTDVCGAMRVVYEGMSYHTVQIGDQCWLEENLNVGTRIEGVNQQTNNSSIEKYCYGDDSTNCSLYGGLYQWDEAMEYSTTPGTQGICPPGWHIPTLAAVQGLSSMVSGDGNALKALGQGAGGGAGTNTSGFSALLAGYRNNSDGGFYNLDSYAYYWSSTEVDATHTYSVNLSYTDGSISIFGGDYKDYGFSVRCLRD